MIIAVDVDPGRLQLARELGADHVLDPGSDDVAACCRELSGGGGVELAFEAVGVTETVRGAIAALKKGGRLTLIGNVSPEIQLPLQAVVTRELTLYGSCASSGEYPECLSLIAGGESEC